MAQRDGAQAAGDGVPAAVKRKPVNGARKGADWERDVADYLVSLGYADARRMIRTGTVKHQDEGDIDGVPFTVQAKDWTRRAPKGITEAQLLDIARETRKQQRAKGHAIGFIVEKVARQPVTHAWAHLDLLTIARYFGNGMPKSLDDAELMHETRVRLRFGYLMRLLVRVYPPS